MQTYIHSVARTHRANYVKQKSNHKKGKPQHRAEKELPESREKKTNTNSTHFYLWIYVRVLTFFGLNRIYELFCHLKVIKISSESDGMELKIYKLWWNDMAYVPEALSTTTIQKREIQIVSACHKEPIFWSFFSKYQAQFWGSFDTDWNRNSSSIDLIALLKNCGALFYWSFYRVCFLYTN